MKGRIRIKDRAAIIRAQANFASTPLEDDARAVVEPEEGFIPPARFACFTL